MKMHKRTILSFFLSTVFLISSCSETKKEYTVNVKDYVEYYASHKADEEYYKTHDLDYKYLYDIDFDDAEINTSSSKKTYEFTTMQSLFAPTAKLYIDTDIDDNVTCVEATMTYTVAETSFKPDDFYVYCANIIGGLIETPLYVILGEYIPKLFESSSITIQEGWDISLESSDSEEMIYFYITKISEEGSSQQ